jgi:hypothetical protein
MRGLTDHSRGEGLSLPHQLGGILLYCQETVGREKTLEALALIEQLPIDILLVDEQLIVEAAEIKSEFPIAYADPFCAATWTWGRWY